jgi:hypothetical protein
MKGFYQAIGVLLLCVQLVSLQSLHPLIYIYYLLNIKSVRAHEECLIAGELAKNATKCQIMQSKGGKNLKKYTFCVILLEFPNVFSTFVPDFCIL